MSEKAVPSTVESLKWIYGVVIALSITEAFRQFALDGNSTVAGIQWDRFLPLFSLLLLVVPFYHGMSRYFCEMYDPSKIDRHYGLWLLVDSFAFVVEAGLFFVLARSLSRPLWLQFNVAVITLLFGDVLWGVFAWRYRTCSISFWVIVNLCTVPFLVAILLVSRNGASWWGMSLASFVILVRAMADYWAGWRFYFPEQTRDETQRNQ